MNVENTSSKRRGANRYITFLFFCGTSFVCKLTSSFRSSLKSEVTIRTTTIENGSAAMIAAICSAFNPPACNKIAAMIAIVNPHISFKLFLVISFRYSFA